MPAYSNLSAGFVLTQAQSSATWRRTSAYRCHPRQGVCQRWLFFPTYSALPPRHQASLTSGKRHPRRWKEPARGTLLRLCYGARLALFHTMRMQQRRRFKAVSFTDNPNADGPTTSQAFAGASRNFEPYSAPWHRAPPECRDKSVQTL